MRKDSIASTRFRDIDLRDPFFDSLRSAYPDFDSWFLKKSRNGQFAYVTYDDNGQIVAMMYLKDEDGYDDSIEPILGGRRLKIGTFKIDFEHHTGLGRRYLAIALRRFASGDYDYAYVTMFAGQSNVIALERMLLKYGFEKWGVKQEEDVLIKRRPESGQGDPCADFPFVDLSNKKCWLLAIYPKYHIRMFGETDLKSEGGIPVKDEKSINSIEKVYLSGSMNCMELSRGDLLLMYRTGDGQGPAYYRSVISSICAVLSVKHLNEFGSFQEFKGHIRGKSVFNDDELRLFWRTRKYPWIITMLYNLPFEKYPNRGLLLEKGLIPVDRIVCEPVTKDCLVEIAKLGGVNESYLLD